MQILHKGPETGSRAHLYDACRWVDVLDLIAQRLQAPRLSRLVDGAYDGGIQRLTLLKRLCRQRQNKIAVR